MPCKITDILFKILYSQVILFPLITIIPASTSASTQDVKNREGIYSVMDPRGIWPTIERIPLSPRLSSLKGKRIYMINSWDSGTGFETFLLNIEKRLRERHPDMVITIKGRNTGYSEDDPALWDEMQKKGT
jgi:hypothetical protein